MGQEEESEVEMMAAQASADPLGVPRAEQTLQRLSCLGKGARPFYTPCWPVVDGGCPWTGP